MVTSVKKKGQLYIILGFLSLLVLFLFRFIIHESSHDISESNFLFIHTLLELFSVFVSFSIFVHARISFKDYPSYFFIGLVFLSVGVFDLLHTLTYKGMPYFNDELAVSRATWYWIIARMTESVGILIFVVKPEKLIGKNRTFGIVLTFLITMICSIIIFFFPNQLPTLFNEATGLTQLKIALEYAITVVNCTTLFLLFRRYRANKEINSLRLIFAVFLVTMGELFFTIYKNVFAFENLLGHVYKFTGYLFLYRSLFYPHIHSMITDKEVAEKKRLEAETKLHEVEKNLSQQIFDAHEDERKRVSRELHDGIGQSLYSILIILNTARKETSPEKKDAMIETIREITQNAMKETKEIAHSLRPSSLDDLGFIPTLRSYLETYKQIHSIDIQFEYTSNIGRLKPDIETALYRICQEALTNAAKYAQPSLIEVTIRIDENVASLTIQDNGNGFLVDDYMKNSKRKGIGLYSIKERAEGLGGTAQIHSEIGSGTTINIKIPRNEF